MESGHATTVTLRQSKVSDGKCIIILEGYSSGACFTLEKEMAPISSKSLKDQEDQCGIVGGLPPWGLKIGFTPICGRSASDSKILPLLAETFLPIQQIFSLFNLPSHDQCPLSLCPMYVIEPRFPDDDMGPLTNHCSSLNEIN